MNSKIESLAEAYANNLSAEVEKPGIDEGKIRLIRIAAKKAFYEGCYVVINR